ncbi:hypothetical protein [Nocardioides sp.]|uniref:hypothetical protein n=1 Tax=Nocardioides sp. TaxID=35761 RepID=UPI002B52D14F|nr:hypothetical protein [Nocardioides sp.]HXH81090.1 hypothetical protein [Nocardioides sp.]
MNIQGDLQSLPEAMRDRLAAWGAPRAWDVSATTYGPRAFAVGEDGVLVVNAEPAADLFAPWADVIGLSFPTQVQAELKVRNHEPVLMTLQHLRHRNDMVDAIPLRERLRVADTGAPAAGLPPAPDRPEASGDPVTTLWWLLMLGIVLQVFGGLVIGGSSAGPSGFDDEGNTGGLLSGWLLGGAGTLAALVAVVGFGTMLGIRAARQQR